MTLAERRVLLTPRNGLLRAVTLVYQRLERETAKMQFARSWPFVKLRNEKDTPKLMTTGDSRRSGIHRCSARRKEPSDGHQDEVPNNDQNVFQSSPSLHRALKSQKRTVV